jgi:Tfp pilus assembly protein PilF
MRNNCSRMLLAGFVTASLSGCLTTKPESLDSFGQEAEMDANRKLELPAKQASRACLATAQMLDKQGKWTEAVFEYEKARTNDESLNKYVCRRLAVLYDNLGDFAKADREYERALALHPSDAALLNDVGYSHYLRGDWILAEDYLRQAVNINPGHKTAWINLGMTFAQRNQLDRAFDAFNHAVPEPEAHCNMAFAFSLQGKHQEAIREYRLALELAPDLEKAQAALFKLEHPNAGTSPVAQEIVPQAGGFAAHRAN